MADVNANIGVNIDTSAALAQLKALQRQISQFHTSIAKSSEAAGLAQRDLQKNFINSINSIGAFSAELRTVKTTAESFTDSLQNNKFSMREYFRYAGASTKTFGKLFKSEFDTIGKVAEDRVKRLQTQYIKLGRDTNGAMKAIAVMPNQLDMNSYATKAQLAAQKQAIFNQLVKQGSTNLLNFGKNTQWAGRQLMVGFTLPLATLGMTASRTFMEMEQQTIKFRKVYGDLFTPTEETNQALENITALASTFTKYGVAVSQTVGLAADAAAAGFAGLDLTRQTTEATRLSILGQIDSNKALETTISLQNAFKSSSEELASSIDFLNAVENQTVISLDDITTAIPKVAPVIQQLGGDVRDLAFFMAAMKEGGINASQGANALKSGLASLINPSTAATKMLGDFGININKIVESNQGDLKTTVIEFAQALDTLDPLARARAIEQLFGKFQFARMSTLFDNVTSQSNQASRVLDLANSSVEELAALSEKELGISADSAMNKFRNSVEQLKISLVPVGQAFLEAVTPIVDFLGGIVKRFDNLSSGAKKAIVVLTVAIGAIGPVALMTFGLLANALANILKGAMVLRNGYLRLTGQTQILGEQTNYLNMEQLDAAAASHSLDQSHARLTQTFTAEAGAIAQLIAAYQAASVAGARFATLNPGMMSAPTPKKFASGVVSVPGPKGAGDVVPAMLSPGESVIPADMTQKYGGLIQGMVADNIPGYADGLSYGGKEYNIPIRSQSAIDAVLAKFSSDVSGITAVLDALERQALELGTGFSVTAKSLKSMLTEQGVPRNNTKGVSSSGGYVFAHAMEPIEQITDKARLMDLAMTENLGELKKHLESAAKSARGYANVMSNFGFILPENANKGKMSPQSISQEFQGDNISRTMSPVMREYARTMGMTLDEALSDPAIKQQMFSDINQYADAISHEIAQVPGEFLQDPDFYAAVDRAEQGLTGTISSMLTQAIANMKTPTTIGVFGVEGNRASKGNRIGIPQKAKELRAELGTAEGITSYRGNTASYVQQGQQVGLQMGDLIAQSIVQGARESLNSRSPSEEMKNVGRDGGKGLILGAQEYVDDAKVVGQQLGTAVVTGAGAGSLGGGGAGSAGIPMSGIASGTSFSPATKIAADESLARTKTMNERMSKLNSGIMGGTFALTSLAGAGSFAGGTLGKISQQVMKFSGLLFGLMSITQLLTQAKVAELVATRVGLTKSAVANAMSSGKMFGGASTAIAGRSGILGTIGRVALRLKTFLGPIGLVTTALSLAYIGFKQYRKSQEQARLRIEGLGDAALLSTGQLKTLGDFFGVTTNPTPFESTKPQLITSSAQRSDLERLKAEESFQTAFKTDIETLKGASDKQAKLIFDSLSIQLKGSGYASEQVETILKALQEESGKTSIELDFNRLDLKTSEGQADLKKNVDSMMKVYQKSFKTGFTQVIKQELVAGTALNQEWAESVENLMNEDLRQTVDFFGKQLSASFNGLSGQLATGAINAEQFNQSFNLIEDSIRSMPEPEQLLVMNSVMSRLPENLQKAAAGIDNVSSRLLILKAQALGISVTAGVLQAMALLESNSTGGQSAIIAAQKLAEFEKSFKKAAARAEKLNREAFSPSKGEGKKNPIKERIKAIKQQTEAYTILRNAKVNDKIATELSNDAEIAALVIANSKGKSLKQITALIKEYSKALKDQSKAAEEGKSEQQKYKDALSSALALANLREKLIDIDFESRIKKETDELEKQEDALQAVNDKIDLINQEEIRPKQDIIDANNFELEAIGILEDAINDKYDTQIKALDKVAQANQEINNIQKQRLSIADALTTGDIAAAAAAVQEARSQQAQSAIERQKTSLTASRDNAIDSLGRKTIEQKNKALQFEISTIQRGNLLTLEKQKIVIEETIDTITRNIQKLEKEVTMAKDVLYYNGLTKQELEKFDELIGLAEAAGIEFDKTLLSQAGNAKDLADALLDAVNNQKALLEAQGKLPSAVVSDQSGNSNFTQENMVKNTDDTPWIPEIKLPTPTTKPGDAGFIGPVAPSRGMSDSAATAQEMILARKGKLGYIANGGLIPKYFVSGGYAKGTDTVPAMLSPGEFVVSKYAVDKFGVDNLKSINSGTAAPSSNSVYNYGINVNVSNSNASTDQIARAVITQIKNIDNQRIRGQRY